MASMLVETRDPRARGPSGRTQLRRRAGRGDRVNSMGKTLVALSAVVAMCAVCSQLCWRTPR